jgi:hypothetical protein
MTIQNSVKHALGALVGGALVVAAGLPAHGAMTRDNGKNASWASVSGVTFPPGTATILTATIAKGKKKKVLEVDATIVESTNTATGLGVVVRVNGITMEPTGAFFQTEEGCSAAISNCTAQGMYWIDLDQAEAANPGLFIGQPLVVELQASSAGTGTISGIASLRARLVRP